MNYRSKVELREGFRLGALVCEPRRQDDERRRVCHANARLKNPERGDTATAPVNGAREIGMGAVVSIQGDNVCRVSGCELPHGSTNVWAIEALRSTRGKKAHFWSFRSGGYQRECDKYVAPPFLWNGQTTIFGAGNFIKCKRCMRLKVSESLSTARGNLE